MGREYYNGTKKRTDASIAIAQYIYDDVASKFGCRLESYGPRAYITFDGTIATINLINFSEESARGYIGKRLIVIYDE